MSISEKKMQIVMNNYFNAECNINTSIRGAYEKGFLTGIKLGSQVVEYEREIAKAEMLEEPFKTSMTWEGICSNCGSYTIHEMNYCFGCGAKLYWSWNE